MARRQAPVRVRLSAPAAWEHMARENLSQNELARRLGITSGYLSQLVNGQRCPSPSLRRRLFEVLPGATFEDLFVVERQNQENTHAPGVLANSKTPNEQPSLVVALPPGTSVLPEDFPDRLQRVKEAGRLSWNVLAEKLGVDPRQVMRWRKGVEPSGGAMLALVQLARRVPGGVQMLLGDSASATRRNRGPLTSTGRAW